MEAVVLAACVGLLITLRCLQDQLMSSGTVFLCTGEVERAGQKPWPVLARADDGNTLEPFPSSEVSSRHLSSCTVLLRKLKLGEVMVVLCVVSFLKMSPRRSCTALLDVGPCETFSACLRTLGFDEAGLFWFVALGFNEVRLFRGCCLLALYLWVS